MPLGRGGPATRVAPGTACRMVLRRAVPCGPGRRRSYRSPRSPRRPVGASATWTWCSTGPEAFGRATGTGSSQPVGLRETASGQAAGGKLHRRYQSPPRKSAPCLSAFGEDPQPTGRGIGEGRNPANEAKDSVGPRGQVVLKIPRKSHGLRDAVPRLASPPSGHALGQLTGGYRTGTGPC